MNNLSLQLGKEKNIIRLSLLFFILASLFSYGYHHADEHYQILEFAGSKLGITNVEDLPWEYEARIRPTIQPAIAIGVYQFLDLFGLANPFSVTFVLRLLSAALTFFSWVLLFRTFKSKISHPIFNKWFLWLSFLLWFGLYNGVRFSSENWSGATFVIAFSLYFLSNKKDFILFLGLGCLFGLSFLFRYQAAILVAGFMSWMLILNREKMKNIVLMVLGITLVVGLGILLDSWFYGHWTISFWNYFDVNILQDRAASFGVDPWYFYFTSFFNNGVPPFSILFVGAFIGFVIFKPKSPVTWSVLPFLLIHLLIGHKELRFLFPMVSFMPFIVIGFLQYFQSERKVNFTSNKVFKVFMFLFFMVNFVLIIVVSLRPASPLVPLFKKVYFQSEEPINLYFFKDSPYETNNKIYFYRPKDLNLVSIQSLDEIPKNGKNNLVLFENAKEPEIIPSSFAVVYSSYPDWIKFFNFNNWVARSGGWKLYEVTD